jgi:hypothetical protein
MRSFVLGFLCITMRSEPVVTRIVAEPQNVGNQTHVPERVRCPEPRAKLYNGENGHLYSTLLDDGYILTAYGKVPDEGR